MIENKSEQTPASKESMSPRKPKNIGLAFLILVLFGATVLLLRNISPEKPQPQAEEYFPTGLSIDTTIEAHTLYEPVLAGSYKIPMAVDLSSFTPDAENQGRQSSCVGWASAYARSVLESKQTGKDPNYTRFSPSYVFNQIRLNKKHCGTGSYIKDAVKLMQNEGIVPWEDMPYDYGSCGLDPTEAMRVKAQDYQIKSYSVIGKDWTTWKLNLRAIKENLAQGHPLIIGMWVGRSFVRHKGEGFWKPYSRDKPGNSDMSGHAMLCIGYDDTKDAFLVHNSWGDWWGDRGRVWIKYSDFAEYVFQAYAVYPKEKVVKSEKLDIKIELVDETDKPYPLYWDRRGKKKGDRTWSTRKVVKAGDEFRLKVTNNIPVYLYVLSQDENKGSHLIFPLEQNDPFASTPGTRLFPSKYTFAADEGVGVDGYDKIALVVSTEPIDAENLNRKMNESKMDYTRRLRRILKQDEIPMIRFKQNGAISFSTALKGKSAVGMVVQLPRTR